MEKNVSSNLDMELGSIEYKNIKQISKEKIIEIIEIFKNIDSDLVPLLEILENSISEITDNKKATLLLRNLLQFYGFNNSDILKTRQKFIIENNKLIKRPFLKQSQKESINILLRDYEVL